MGTFLGYSCSLCKAEYGPDQLSYTCPEDGSNLDVLLDYEAINRATSIRQISSNPDNSIWRYLPLLPVGHPGEVNTPLTSVGGTPLYEAQKLGNALGLSHLRIKDDGRNPTASFKDRASAVVVQRAKEIGSDVVVTASTGNAGAALAGMAAAAGVPAVVLAPKSAPEAKVAQLLIFGAQVFLVEGSYDDAFDLSLEAAQEFGWYCRNTGYNPFTAEGKKTAAFEICEQLGDRNKWQAPEALFVSVGDGNIISGVHKGFKDLMELGWIDKAPRLYGVQSRGSAAIANAFDQGTENIQAVEANTMADSISVDMPRDGLRALRAATETNGAYIVVDDSAILLAMAEMAGSEAIFAEPAGATPYAGLKVALGDGLVKSNEHIVVLVTGGGLKDVGAAMDATREAQFIEPRLEALKAALEKSRTKP
jgi:threonine synthase